ncbi:MAG: hypothetical protein IT525_03710 [Nitrosomonas sp.]|jgi:hypothetical protein|nr:hypothetical protein [Nitrosomonas sp.]MDR4520420.1 hypothetical protein [Nitrosomonas sp.]MDR4653151.1 hypothetical protein [Nitrosomonas sp.]
MDWMQIVAALALVMFIVFLFPRARYMLENSPKGSSSDWMSFLIPVIAIILFVMLLIQLV